MTYESPSDFPSQDGVPGIWWPTSLRTPSFLLDVPPSSAWEDLALAHIEQHIAREEQAARWYEDFARVEDPQIKYLAAMIAADEHRHHQMLSDIARSLESRVSEKIDDSVTSNAVALSPEREAALLEAARQLLAVEEEDVDELKTLRRDLHLAPSGTIWPLLVEIMELDTQKHIRILKAIERHLTRERWPH